MKNKYPRYYVFTTVGDIIQVWKAVKSDKGVWCMGLGGIYRRPRNSMHSVNTITLSGFTQISYRKYLTIRREQLKKGTPIV